MTSPLESMASRFATRIDPATFSNVASAPDHRSAHLAINAAFCQLMGVPGALASWVPGIPLAVQLALGRRLTVDLTAHHMTRFEENYGITEEALLALAERKLVFLNLRDYDPGLDEARREARYKPHEAFLARLAERAPDAVYFLSLLREAMFDVLPERPEKDRRLVEHFEDARFLGSVHDLVVAAAGSPPGPLFRTEPISANAVRWHWAYVNSVEAFLPRSWIDDVRGRFERLRDAADATKPAATTPAATTLGSDYADLAMRLRYLHLQASAPLSASFGGVYSMTTPQETTAVAEFERLLDAATVPASFHALVQAVREGRLASLCVRPEHKLAAHALGPLMVIDGGAGATGADGVASRLQAYLEETQPLDPANEEINVGLDLHFGSTAMPPQDLLDAAAVEQSARLAAAGRHLGGIAVLVPGIEWDGGGPERFGCWEARRAACLARVVLNEARPAFLHMATPRDARRRLWIEPGAQNRDAIP